jgi:glycosyltransferase involved in cell wall biosynthesis
LLDGLQKLDQRNYYRLIAPAPVNYTVTNPNWCIKTDYVRGKWSTAAWFQLRLPKYLMRLRPDVLWGPRHHLPHIMPGGITSVLTIHDTVHCRYPRSMPLINLLSERINMALSLRRADKLVTVSQSTANDLHHFYPFTKTKTQVIYSGTPHIPAAGQSPSSGSKPLLPQRYLLFVGTAEPRKNLAGVLNAFADISKFDAHLHLVCVGAKGWKNHPLRQSVLLHPARDRIRFTGYVDLNQLARIYQGALCLLFPSRYEGFGFPILEAMSLGVPVITSNVSSMPEVAGQAALTVSPTDIPELTRAIQQVLSDTQLRNGLIEKGKRRARQFSWDKCALKMRCTFEQAGKR